MVLADFFLLSLFSDFFPGSNSYKEIVSTNEKVYEIVGGNYYVRNSLISNISDSGVYFSTSSNVQLLIERSLISYCRSSGNYGGGIYFYCSQGSCVFSQSCAYYCSSHEGHFGYICSGTGKLLTLLLSSVSYCTPFENYVSLYTNDPVEIQEGIQKVENCNFSKNKAQEVSGLHTFRSDSCMFKFSTVTKNHAIYSMCVRFEYGTITLDKVNIVGNTNGQSAWGLIHHGYGNTLTKNCCIQGNTCQTGTIILFYFYSGTAKLQSCWMQTTGTFYQIVHESPVTLSGTFILSQIDLNNCQTQTYPPSFAISRKHMFMVHFLVPFLSK